MSHARTSSEVSKTPQSISSHTRTSSEVSKTPHSVSLKVLRLSPPELTVRHPLPSQPPESKFKVDPKLAPGFPLEDGTDDQFFLSPLLKLPKSFGTTHVGENFDCTLCVNNEIRVGRDGTQKENDEEQKGNVEDEESNVEVGAVKVSAVMQTPSSLDGFPLALLDSLSVPQRSEPGQHERGSSEKQRISQDGGGAGVDLPPGETLQKMVRFALRDEGPHTLAVTVTYTGTPHQPSPQAENDSGGKETLASGSRQRTFRKLYKFVAQQLLSVRTKVRPLPPHQPETAQGQAKFVLEAQLENLSGITVVADGVKLLARSGLRCKSMNAWDIDGLEEMFGASPVLAPGEVLQTCFLVEQTEDEDGEWSELEKTKDGRTILGQLAIHWRGPMGFPGELTTKWLTSGKRQPALG